jgi:predicted metal-dependent TIM-barrel fold hydrolase
MKIEILIGIFKQINKYHSKIYNVDISNKKNNMIIILSVFSRHDKNITELIKALTQMKQYGISTKEIKKDNKKRIYLSDIKVVLNGNI